jgi:AAA domain (Cdc48 subfamily)
MKRNDVVVYIVAAILAWILIQAAIALFVSALPTLVFLAGALLALLCAYAIYTEKGTRRLHAVDRFLGIGNVAAAIGAAPVAVRQPVATPPPASAFSGSPGDDDGPDDQDGLRETPPRRPPPPPPPVNYGDRIKDELAKPPPAPKAPPAPGSGGINYQAIVTRLSAAAPPVPSKEALVAAIARNVVGQRAAIDTIAMYVRGKLGAKDIGKNKPLVLLLPGPTGTGKTEISKAVADALGTKLIRFDMGEYAEEFKASNLFGSSKGYIGSEDGGALPNAIRTGGKRLVILFDEVEKAHKSLWQKMLAFFDEGRAGDSKGNVIAPKDTICMLTTNLRAEDIAKEPDNAREILRHDGTFSPEFFGRVEKVVPMPRLTDADMLQLTHRMADSVAATYGVRLVVDEDALVELFVASRDNAERAGGRGINEKIRDLLIEDLLDLQAGGCDLARLVVSDGKVRALPT